MPIYEYRCSVCGYEEEHKMPMTLSYIKEVECYNCGARSFRIPSTTNFELKGGGWYNSGYSKGS